MAKKHKKSASFQVNPWVGAQIAAQAKPRPARITPKTAVAVGAGFSETDREAALDALRNYRGPETPRVHRAVLALSDGKLAALKSLVRAANSDYRDVLYWAEYPADSTPGTPRKKQAAARKMAARYRRMGLDVPKGD